MTLDQFADIILDPLCDDTAHSLDPPWATCVADGSIETHFDSWRVGNTLYFRHIASGRQFTVTVDEVQP